MDKKAKSAFDEILKLAQKRLDEVKVIAYEIFPSYAVLEFKGRLRKHTLKITEIIDKRRRKYSY
ncbi:MAG: hypothetical protein ACE5EA_01770 [Nitrospirota bacterium]